MFETSLMWLEILSSGLGSIWCGMMWFCRYFDDLGYLLMIIVLAFISYFKLKKAQHWSPTKLSIWFDCLFDLKYSRKVT